MVWDRKSVTIKVVLLIGGVGIVGLMSACGSDGKEALQLKQSVPTTDELVELRGFNPPIRCPKENDGVMTTINDFTTGPEGDGSGGPQTPEEAIEEFFRNQRIYRPTEAIHQPDVNRFVKKSTIDGNDNPEVNVTLTEPRVVYEYTDPKLGQYQMTLEKAGDSWRVRGTQICNSLSNYIRARDVLASNNTVPPAWTKSPLASEGPVAECDKLTIPQNAEINTNYDPEYGVIVLDVGNVEGKADMRVVIPHLDPSCKPTPSLERLISHVVKTYDLNRLGSCTSMKDNIDKGITEFRGVEVDPDAGQRWLNENCPELTKSP